MASLSIPYSDFVAGTTIVSQQADDNNAAIVNYINARNSASSTWDAVSTIGAFTSTLTSNQLILGTTRTVTVTAPTPASSSRAWTIPDITADGTFASLTGTQTFTGTKTFNDLRGTLGANIAAGGNILTGLGAGAAAGNSLRFEQLKVIQYVTATTATDTNTTSSTYASTSLTASITPSSASNKVLVMAMGILVSNSASGAVTAKTAGASIFRGATNLAANSNLLMNEAFNQVSSQATYNNALLLWLDSPAATTSTTYTVKIKSFDNSTQVQWGNGSDQQIVLMELA
jgi:hypothetical protein